MNDADQAELSAVEKPLPSEAHHFSNGFNEKILT
jgi:hypothetical protein